jgi:hypothetical protein
MTDARHLISEEARERFLALHPEFSHDDFTNPASPERAEALYLAALAWCARGSD